MSKDKHNHKMPAIYISHGGGPCFFMEWTMGSPDTWDSMKNWLASIHKTLPEKPRAILLISGHWEEPQFSVYIHENPELFYDYYGFPEHTYRIKYPAPGSPELAKEVIDLFAKNEIPIQTESERGFDHGAFVPLKVMFPDADIPVVQLSLKVGLDPETHLKAGRALAPLREKGVFIVGSGNSFHNLRSMMSGMENYESDAFDTWLDDAVNGPVSERAEKLNNWASAPAARLSHPREEHLLPLMMISGSAEESKGKVIFKDRILGSLNTSYQFD